MPGVTADMLGAGDGRRLRHDDRALPSAWPALLESATSAHLTCPRGSDLTLDLTGRQASPTTATSPSKGAFGNLPCGEGFIAPLSGEGTIVASSLAPLGIEQGARDADGRGRPHRRRRGRTRPRVPGAAAARTASWGPTWPSSASAPTTGPTLTGNVLEDEKILGTVHIAFGASAGIGGTVSVPIHLDVVVLDATLEIGGTRVLDAGRYALA